MSGWTELFLGVIALATVTMAIVQVGVIVVAGRLARRVDQLGDRLERELLPITGYLNAIGRDAARAASLAVAQVERADHLMSEVSDRIEAVIGVMQANFARPARAWRAYAMALKAVLEVVRATRDRRRGRQGRGEDEDALFI